MIDSISAALVHPVPAAVVPILHTSFGRAYLAVGDRDGPSTDGTSPGKTFERAVSLDMAEALMGKMGCVGVLAWWSDLTADRRAWLEASAARGHAIAIITAGHGAGMQAPLPTDWYLIGLVGPGSAALDVQAVDEWVWRLDTVPSALPLALADLSADTALSIQSAVPGAGAEADAWIEQGRALAQEAGLHCVYDAKHQHTVCPNCGESWVARRGPKVRRLVDERCVCGQELPAWL